jgi:CBS domain-containing protein
MTTVKQILETKGNDTYSINPSATVFEALQIMAEKDCGALVVLDDDGKLIGMFSERDYARKIILHGKSSKESMVEDYMTTDLTTAKPDSTTLELMAVMTNKHVRHIPVLDHNKLVGVVSIGDVVNAIIKEQHITIKDLEKYITSSGYGHQ